jgi:hypothetical protein
MQPGRKPMVSEAASGRPTSLLPPGVNPMLIRSHQAFLRDWPEPVKQYRVRWVAYHGDRCVGVADRYTELSEKCRAEGLKEEECCIASVVEGARPAGLGFLCSEHAFSRDLPMLLKTHYGKWVAYWGDQRIGFSRHPADLYEQCYRMGLKDEDFLVEFIDRDAQHHDYEVEIGIGGHDWDCPEEERSGPSSA